MFRLWSVATVIVVLDECLDLRFELTGQVVVFEQDAVLERLVPPLDLALGLGMAWRTAEMLDLLRVEPFSEPSRDVARTVVR